MIQVQYHPVNNYNVVLYFPWTGFSTLFTKPTLLINANTLPDLYMTLRRKSLISQKFTHTHTHVAGRVFFVDNRNNNYFPNRTGISSHSGAAEVARSIQIAWATHTLTVSECAKDTSADTSPVTVLQRHTASPRRRTHTHTHTHTNTDILTHEQYTHTKMHSHTRHAQTHTKHVRAL